MSVSIDQARGYGDITEIDRLDVWPGILLDLRRWTDGCDSTVGDEYALLVLRRFRNAIGEAGSVNERRIIVFHIGPFEKGIDLRVE